MSQDSIGVVTTGRGKLQEWKTTQKQNLSRRSRGTLTVKWAGSRDKILSPSGRGRTFFLTFLFIEPVRLPSFKTRLAWSPLDHENHRNGRQLRSKTSRADREALLQ